jgi:hypothetical protein
MTRVLESTERGFDERTRAHENLLGKLEADAREARILVSDALAEIERLRARLLHYEAIAATAFGTLEKSPEPDEPFTVTHNVPGNAPT